MSLFHKPSPSASPGLLGSSCTPLLGSWLLTWGPGPPPVWAYLSFLPEQAPLPTQVPRKAGPGESPASPHASSLMLAL